VLTLAHRPLLPAGPSKPSALTNTVFSEL